MHNENGEDTFKKRFKFFKLIKETPLLEHVIRFGHNENTEKQYYSQIPITVSTDDTRVSALGLKDLKTWKVYSLKSPSGLVVIRNPFTALGQRYWIRRCLQDFPRKPNKINIDFETCINDWWSKCFINNTCNRKLQQKLRWTTIGYHHNWDTKMYSEESKSEFPGDLSSLCDVVAQFLGYCGFNAEAAIINYYHANSTLSPHTDHSEANLDAPLFSFSFGQSAVFLIGGADRSVEPTALLLESGDVVAMAGAARLAYHAVPRIVPAAQDPWNDVTDATDLRYNLQNTSIKCSADNTSDRGLLNPDAWKPFDDYITGSRINMNVRQVLRENQRSLLEC